MGRPKIPYSTQLQIGLLYEQRASIDKVFEELHHDGIPSVARSTVQTYVNEYKNKWRPILRPVDWSTLPEFGLPWESLGLLLQIWRDTWGDPRQPTVTECRWWWRIHCAVPDAHPSQVRQLAFPFVLRDALRLLGDPNVPQADSDLWAWVSYRLWQAPPGLQIGEEWLQEHKERQRRYQEDYNLGKIPFCQDPVFSYDNADFGTPACLYDIQPGLWVAWPYQL